MSETTDDVRRNAEFLAGYGDTADEHLPHGTALRVLNDMRKRAGQVSRAYLAMIDKSPLTLDAARAMLPAGWELDKYYHYEKSYWLLSFTDNLDRQSLIRLPLDTTVGEFASLLRGLRAN